MPMIDEGELDRLRQDKARLEEELRLVRALVHAAPVVGMRGGPLLEGLVRHAPIGILVTDPSGQLLFTNQRYKDIFGEDVPDTIQEYSRWTVLDASGRPRDAANDSAIVHALRGDTVTHELRFQRTDGAERWVRITAAPIRDETGRIAGAVGLCDDISEDIALAASRDRLLMQVEEEREKLRALVTHLPVAAVAFEVPEFRIELANEAYEAIVGRRGMVGTKLDEIHPGVATDSIRSHLTEVYRHKKPRVRREHPLRLPGPDGVLEERYFSNTFQPLFDGAGNVRSIVATVMEVTHEVRARQTEEEATSRLRAILDEMPVGVLVRDSATGRVLLANKASSDILGMDMMSSGDTDPLLVARHPNGPPLSEERPHRVVMRTGQAVQNQTLFVRRADTGEEIVIRTSAAPLAGYRKQPLVVSVFEDVSEEHRLLAERERTGRFAETFMAVLGHDLRNPLNSIVIGAELLEMGGRLDDAGSRRVRQIASSGRRMARMVDQLLDMTRARLGGGIPIHRSMTDLAAVAANAIEELAVANPSVEIVRVLPAPLVGAWDGDRLAQVVSNLVGNAIAHGDPKRAVTVTLEGGTGATLTLSVHNHGPAIPDDLIRSLFDPFRRGARNGSPKSKGLGLGLFITREIVVAHGGNVQVSSTEAEGSRFVVTLPVLPVGADSRAADASKTGEDEALNRCRDAGAGSCQPAAR